jgi:allantoicase
VNDFERFPDLAARPLGGSVVAASDEFFADKENLIRPGPPTFTPQTFNHRGQVYDGWETRRRRDGGSADWVIVRLGAPGVVRGVVVDTAFFVRNYPPACSVEATAVVGYPSPAELADAAWLPLVPRSPLRGDSQAGFHVSTTQRFTHLRLSIYPDGGVARFRVHGEPVPDPRGLAGTPFDLAALENGGAVVGCSDDFYANAYHLLHPGMARTAGEGWETSRRRDGGCDWVTVRLAAASVPQAVEVDTSHFRGNAPDRVVVLGALCPSGDPDPDAAWQPLLPPTRVQPDTRHRLRLRGTGPVTHLRVEIHPDGGMARFHAYGELTPQGRDTLAARWFNSLPDGYARTVLAEQGVTGREATKLLASRPVTSVPEHVLPR